MKMTRKKVWSAVITLLSIALGVIWLAPLIWLVGTALTETTFHMTFLPTTPFTLDNIKYVWNAVPFGQYYLNTIILVVGTFCIQFVTSTLAAYSLAFYRFKGQGLVFLIIFMQIIIPNDVLMKAKYEEPLSAADLALAQLRANNQAGQKTLNNLTDDLANSGAGSVGTVPNVGNDGGSQQKAEQREAKVGGLVNALKGDKRRGK